MSQRAAVELVQRLDQILAGLIVTDAGAWQDQAGAVKDQRQDRF